MKNDFYANQTCPNCGSPLSWSDDLQTFVCEVCGEEVDDPIEDTSADEDDAFNEQNIEEEDEETDDLYEQEEEAAEDDLLLGLSLYDYFGW